MYFTTPNISSGYLIKDGSIGIIPANSPNTISDAAFHHK